MTRDLFQIKRAVEAGAYDRVPPGEHLDRLAADLFRVNLRVQLPVAKPKEGTEAAGSVSEKPKAEKAE